MNNYSKKLYAIYTVCMFGLLSFSSTIQSMMRMYVGVRPLQRIEVKTEQKTQKEVMGRKKATESASVGLLKAKSTRTHKPEHTRSASLGEEWLGKSQHEISAGNAFAAADEVRYKSES